MHSDPALIDRLTDCFKQGIAQLHQLLMLAQTENLILQQLETAELDEVVQSKQRLVENIGRLEKETAEVKAGIGSELLMIPKAQRELLAKMESEAAALIARISEVDERNRLLLKEVRSQTLETWLVTRQEHRLHTAYQQS
jgi:hypothetical protein